jgi:hypothetical protein
MLNFVASRPGVAQPPVPIAFEDLTVLARPSIAFMHHQTLPIAATLPPDGVTVRVRCRINRVAARPYCDWVLDGPPIMAVGHAVIGPPPATAEATAPAEDSGAAQVDTRRFAHMAEQRAEAYQFDLSATDRDDPTLLVTEFDVRISPSDVRQVDLSAPTRIAAEVGFTRFITAAQLERHYPRAALDAGQAGDVMVACHIFEDGSVLCGNPRAADAATVERFGEAAVTIAEYLFAAPTLRDGSPSVGVVFDISIGFRLAD